MVTKTRIFAGTCAALIAGAATTPFVGRTAEATSATNKPKPALIELGRRLFMDPTVSRLGAHSCAGCHDPEQGFSDPRKQSTDDAGPTKRHSQPLVDLAGDGFHWDGQFKSVRQLLVARVAPADMANKQSLALAAERRAEAIRGGDSPTTDGPRPVPGTRQDPPPPTGGYGLVAPSDVALTPVADRLAEDGRYAESFKAAFGAPAPTTEHILDALDAYCASIRSTTNAFDRFMAGDDAALSPAAQRGLALFDGKAGCATCHLTKSVDGRAPFTDGKFHDTGVAYHGDPIWRSGLEGADPADLGRKEATFKKADGGRFKTPTLRDVGLRGPFMHDASFATLTDVVKYYSAGGTKNPNLDPAIRRLDLTDAEIFDVVAFLESLTGGTRAALGVPPRHAAPLHVRVEDLAGRPMPAFTITVAAFGDRFVGAESVAVPSQVVTNDHGEASIDRPLTTHVALSNPDYVLGLSRPIPDSCETQTLIATKRDVVSLRVRRTFDGPTLPESIAVAPVPPGSNGAPMGGCGGAAGGGTAVTLVRMRALGADEAIYAGQALARDVTRRCVLVFENGGRTVLADVALGGGASESILIGPAPRRRPN
jgi:cytochrome c peroxidase